MLRVGSLAYTVEELKDKFGPPWGHSIANNRIPRSFLENKDS